MRYGVYLKERFGELLLLCGITATVEIFLLTLQAGPALGIYTAVCFFGLYFMLSFGEFRRKKAYFSDLTEKMERLDKKYLLCEMQKPASNQEERLLAEILQELGKSMADEVAGYRHVEREYKEYIELWIHEVKTPIAAGKLMLENHKGPLAEELEEELEKIEGYTEQALFYARSAHVEKDYQIAPVALREAVSQAVRRNKKALIAKKAHIEMEGLEGTVYSDERWLLFILNQILANSIKYSDKEALKLLFTEEEGGEQTVLSIRDNGRGIGAGDLGRVFEKGFTGSKGRQQGQATGIGLYLCRKLCRRLGHGIEANSREGEGFEIRLIFPKGSYTDIR